MSNEITTSQLQAWAGLAWSWQKLAEFSSPKYSLGPGVLLTDERDGTPWGDTIDQTNADLIVSAPALAAALLAERKAREVEVGELRAVLDDIFEMWAGSEGFIPETAPEGYLLELIRRMAMRARAVL